jgi:hypothetical protein
MTWMPATSAGMTAEVVSWACASLPPPRAQLNKLVLDEPVASGRTLVVPRMIFAPTLASLPRARSRSADNSN